MGKLFLAAAVTPRSHAPAWDRLVPTPERGNQGMGRLTRFLSELNSSSHKKIEERSGGSDHHAENGLSPVT